MQVLRAHAGDIMTPKTLRYFSRFGWGERLLHQPPPPGLGLVVVIPCFNEPDLAKALDSLWRCRRPSAPTEVIVVLNGSEDDTSAVLHQNGQTFVETQLWIQKHQAPALAFYLIHAPNLPSKIAGVGLARKLGMDEALRRFDDAGNLEGVMGCFDADCQCDPNYLVALEHHFQTRQESPGCSIRFEHPLEGPCHPLIYDGVAAYELHLRYYVQGLRLVRLPFAYHTVGSSMAVRAWAYRDQGGMNKRQAGEDFYFLHKIIRLDGFSELNTTRVLPSPRPSDRVPFGTGKAVRQFLESGRTPSYPVQAFLDLKQLTAWVESCRQGDDTFLQPWETLPSPLVAFLHHHGFASAIREIQSNTASFAGFQKRFFRWFDAFRTMKYIHFARDAHYGTQEIGAAAEQLWKCMSGAAMASPLTIREWLHLYRQLQSGQALPPNAAAPPPAGF